MEDGRSIKHMLDGRNLSLLSFVPSRALSQSHFTPFFIIFPSDHISIMGKRDEVNGILLDFFDHQPKSKLFLLLIVRKKRWKKKRMRRKRVHYYCLRPFPWVHSISFSSLVISFLFFILKHSAFVPREHNQMPKGTFLKTFFPFYNVSERQQKKWLFSF